jgi:hypothetical protein
MISGFLYFLKPGGFTMGHFARLQLIGRVTYYLGWIALLCGGLAHLKIAQGLFLAMTLSQWNLYEVSVICFLICMASELRARDSTGAVVSHVVKRQAAA